jgi:uncharacterized membrane protein
MIDVPGNDEVPEMAHRPKMNLPPSVDVAEGESRTVSQVDGTSAAEPPRLNVKLQGSDSVVEAVGDGAKLLNQFGITAVVLSVFLVMFVVGAWFIRQDYLAGDAARTKSHEHSISEMVDSHERKFKMLISNFENLRKDWRDDAKEDRADTKTHQEKMWAGMRDNTAAVRECNATMQKTADLIGLQVEEMKKLIAQPKGKS